MPGSGLTFPITESYWEHGLFWEHRSPFLFGRFRVFASERENDDMCVGTMVVKPAGAGSRIEWEVSPPGVPEGETTDSGTVRITDEVDQEAALAEAKRRIAAALGRVDAS